MDNGDFESLKRGLVEAKAYLGGARKGYLVHEPVDIKALRTRTRMSQAKFARAYHLPLGTVKDWEQGRRQPDAPARALLAIIERAPEEAMKILAEA
jgi:putative transcriptional regulator